MGRKGKNHLGLPKPRPWVERILPCREYSHYSSIPSRSPPDCELLTDVTLAFGHFSTGLRGALTKPTKIELTSRKPSLPRAFTGYMVFSLAFVDSEQGGNVAKLIAMKTYRLDNVLVSDSKKQYAQALDLASALRITPFV